MYNLLISLGAAAVVFVILMFAVNVPWWISLLVALSLFAVMYILAMRYVMKKVSAAMESAGKDLQGSVLTRPSGHSRKCFAMASGSFRYAVRSTRRSG